MGYARALLAQANGDTEAALHLYDMLANDHDQLNRARAAWRAVDLRLATGKIDTKQAADALDKLLYAWRGDQRDLALRVRLADLRAQSGGWRAALSLLREAEVDFPDQATDIANRLRVTFSTLLSDDGADKLPALELLGAATRATPDGPPLADVDLTVGHGEIVGIAGVEGNGQRTLVNAIAGLCALSAGRLNCGGRDLTRTSLLERRGHGLRIIPFERNVEGLSLSSALWQNWSARLLVAGRQLRLVDPQRLRGLCRSALERWSVRFASVDQPAGALSGGNAQKTIFAREIDDDAMLIVAAQPTRGLDIAATAFVWAALRAARERGCGVLVISSDLDELFDISDRVVVMLSGRIVGEFCAPYDLGAIGAAMTGASSAALTLATP